MTREAKLPAWAKALAPGKIQADAEQFYPAILAELGIEAGKETPYDLEVAFQFMKMDVQAAVFGTDLAAKPGGALSIIVVDDSRAANNGVSRWAQKNRRFTDAQRVEALKASKGKEARAHYLRVRGFLPAG